MRGTFDYIKKQGATIVRIYAMYEPLKFFFLAGSAIFGFGPCSCWRASCTSSCLRRHVRQPHASRSSLAACC